MDPIELVKAMLVPGSTGFLLLGLTAGLVLLATEGRSRRWGVRWLVLLAALYWVLSLPITAAGLEAVLDSGSVPLSEAPPTGADVVIVFAGGSETFRAGDLAFSAPSESTALRALEGARLYHLLGQPRVIASGGPGGEGGRGEPESSILRAILQAHGVAPDRILEESRSTSTREEALLLADMLAGMDAGQVIVVTSPSHMRRVLGALAEEGISALGSPSREHNATHQGGSPLLPGDRALGDSRQAMREILALIYYGVRGWLAPIGP
jgi:uncharacterized SAM-binding protein YcdF (DUF218 family)